MTRLRGDPNALQKVLFAVGFRLPDRNREWVRHELTDAGWRGRMVLRHLVVMLPICAALALLPGPLWLHITVPVLFLLSSVGIIAMYADDMRVARLRRHGLEPPDDPDLGRPSHLPASSPNPVIMGPTGKVCRERPTITDGGASDHDPGIGAAPHTLTAAWWVHPGNAWGC